MDESSFLDRHSPIEQSKRNLPHWHQDGKLQFITFRTADSLPQSVLADLKFRKAQWLASHPKPWDETTQKEYHQLFDVEVDRWLDKGHGECLLRRKDVAQIVEDRLFHFHGQRWLIHAYVIMPNHVHVILESLEDYKTEEILQSIKSVSSHTINQILHRKGKFWQVEYYDRLVRNETHYDNLRKYIQKNVLQGGIL